ncbi:hypothetical protein GCM10010399_24960 [Dactylosporangium fulvum]
MPEMPAVAAPLLKRRTSLVVTARSKRQQKGGSIRRLKGAQMRESILVSYTTPVYVVLRHVAAVHMPGARLSSSGSAYRAESA